MTDKKRVDRRSFMARVVGGAAATGALTAVTGCAGLGATDADPYDVAGMGSGGYGRTDSDPYDLAGQGGGGGGGGGYTRTDTDSYDAVGEGTSAPVCSDTDSTDRANFGRRCQPGATGRTDADSYDAVGQGGGGGGGYSRTDADSYDAVGEGTSAPVCTDADSTDRANFGRRCGR